MGFGSSKEKKPEVPPVTDKDLKTLLNIAQIRCSQLRNKTVDRIKRRKEEIINCLKQNNMDLASAKTDNMLKDEDLISVYDILGPIIEVVKEKCIYIISNNDCPADLRAPLDTIIYAAARIEMDELNKFREKIKQHYGEAYIIKADGNADKFVNANLVEKLKATPFSKAIIDLRIKQICNEKHIKCNIQDVVPSGDWEVKPSELNMDRNPYESMRPNLPTQSFVQKNSQNIEQSPYPDIDSSPQPFQGGYQDGFPRDNNQGGFPGMGGQDFNQGGFPGQNNQNSGFPSNQNSGFPSNQNSGFPSNQNSGFPSNQNSGFPNNQNSGFPSMNNQGGFPSQNPYDNSFNNSKANNGSMKLGENPNPDDIIGKTVLSTGPISEKSESKEESKLTNNPSDVKFENPFDKKTLLETKASNPQPAKSQQLYNPENPFGGNTSDTINLSANIPAKTQPIKNSTENVFGGETSNTMKLFGNMQINPQQSSGVNNKSGEDQNKTMNNSIANPGNKENPFEGGISGGPTVFSPDTLNLNNGSGFNPNASGAKLDDPFGGQTANTSVKKSTGGENENNKSVQKSGVDPYAPGANGTGTIAHHGQGDHWVIL